MVSLPTDLMVATELEFIGTTGMQPNRYGELIDLVAAGELDPSKIISEEIALEDVSETLERMANFETQGIPVITSF
jgi:alcohol dehydrogenase